MATLQRFEELKAWQQARLVSKEVYQITSTGVFARDFDLRSQIRRASGSAMDNIAEGFERGGKGEFIQFLGMAKGSAGEVRSQLYRALDQHYIDQAAFNHLCQQTELISKLIANLIAYLNRTDYKGTKYIVKEELGEYNIEPQTSNMKPYEV